MNAKLIVIVDSRDPKKVIGFSSTAPLSFIFSALLATPEGNAPPVDMSVKTSDEMGIYPDEARRVTPRAPSRTGSMDAALKARTDCPIILESKGELGAMLSILSERVAQGGK